MKKFKTLLLSTMCLLLSFMTFTACKEKEGSFNLSQNSVELILDNENEKRFDLKPLISLENLELKDLTFTSNNNNIAYITPNYEVYAVAQGNTVVRISYGSFYKDFSVVVKKSPTKLPTPTGIYYNAELGRVVWNEVFGEYENQTFKANNYTIAVKKSGETDFTEQDPISNRTYFEITEPGTYTVKVKTNERSEELVSSDYSEEYTFKILAKPTLVKFDGTTHILSWEGETDNYRVYINNVQYGNVINQKSLKLELLETKTYKVCIEAVENNMNSSKSEEITITKLASPTAVVEDGYVKWLNQNGVSGYKIEISDETNNNTEEITVGGNVNRYKLEGSKYDNTKQLITVTALGMKNGLDNNYYISSDKSNQVSVIKLKSNQLLFDVNEKKLSLALDVPFNTIVRVDIEETEDVIYLNPANQYKYLFDFEVGDYTLTATVLAPQNSNEYLNSDASDPIIISVLAPVTNLTHTVDENNNGILEFNNVLNANEYNIVKIYDNQEEGVPNVVIDQGKYNIGNVDSVFKDAGDYTLKVEATNTLNGENKHYYIPSSQIITITRLANVETINIESYKFIWSRVENAIQYAYEYNKKGEIIVGTTNLLIYEDATIYNNYGIYSIKVKALGNGKNILNSLDYKQESWSETQNLASPVLNFDIASQTLKVSKNKIEDEVQNVVTKVWCNDVELTITPTYNQEENCNIYDLSTLIVNSGTYDIKAKVVNNSIDEVEKLIVPSETSTLKIVRLDTPESITINESTVIVEDLTSNQFVLDDNSYDLYINNEKTNVLDDSTTFTITLKYNAVGEYQGAYYLDSPVVTFEIERIATPNKAQYLNGNLITEISSIEDVKTYLILQQNNTNISQWTELSLIENFMSSAIIETSNINKEQPFDIYVKYGFDKDIVVNKGEKQYISSLLSESITISKLQAPNSLRIEKGEKIKIVWEEVENADSYLIEIQSEFSNSSAIIEDNYFEETDEINFDNAGEYTVTVTAKSSKYISSNCSSINIERLSSPAFISIDSNENIVVSNDVVDNKKLEKIKIEIQSESISRQELIELNVKNYNESFKIFATNIAKETSNNGTYYLTSLESEFTFNRISKTSNITISDNIISWGKNDDEDGYELKFEQDDIVKYLNVTVNEISINSQQIENIISQFNEGFITVSVRPLTKNIQNGLPNTVLMLSCLDYTVANQIISILNAPTDLKITSSGEFSENLKIYFKHNLLNTKQVDVYNNGDLLESFAKSNITQEEINEEIYNVITFTNSFIEEIKHNITIVAVGENGHASSKQSDVVSFTRLKPTEKSAISIDSTGLLKWQNISNASSYKLLLKLNGQDVKEYIVDENPLNIYEELLDNDTLVVGDAEIIVRTIGDGVNYLNSKNSETYSFNILEIPTMEIGLDNIVVKHSDMQTKINITIKKGETVVTETILNPNDKFDIPTSYSAGKYEVTIFAKSVLSSGVITSQTYVQEFTKLEEISGYNFIKVDDGQENYFRMQANKNQFASGYELTVKSYKTNEYSLQGDLIYYNITNQLEKVIDSGTFTMNVQAIGGKIGSVYYTNSNISSISASRLKQVENFVAYGDLTWKNRVNNNGYILRVNSDYINLSKDSTTYMLSDYVGSLVLNIKALGNVGYEPVSANAILDSKYIGIYNEDVFEETNLTATKLEEVSYLSVNDGYITFNYNSENEYELIASNSKTYYASQSDLMVIDDNVMLYNDKMYNDFKKNQVYSIRIKAISLNNNVLNSNLSEIALNVTIPENTINPTWTLDELTQGKYDLSNTKIVWEDLDKGNGYLVRLDGEAKDYNAREYLILDFESGAFTFEVAIKGSSELVDDAYILTSKYSELKTFNVLDKTNIKVKNGQIVWDKVENASKYYIYLNNKETKIETNNNYIDESVIGQKIPVGTYNIYVQAVTDTENYFQGKVASYVDEEENLIDVIKLASPKDLTLTDGTLAYSEGISLLGSETPFKYETKNAIDQVLKYKLISTTNSIYYTNIQALYHLNIDVDSILTNPFLQPFLTEEYREFLNSYKLKVYGWPNYTRLFDEFASHIPAGEYQLSISQIGNNLNYLTSEFGNTKTVYVPNAPKIYVSYSNGIYTLNISEVVIPSSITTEDVVYEVYGAYLDGDVEKFKLLSSSTSRSVNLTELVNSNEIDENFTHFFAFVKGDSNKVLNGKTSNKIEVKVLTEVDASIQDGVINWKSQTFASGFKITYKNAETGDTGEVLVTENLWNSDEWLEGNTYIDVKIQALGTENNQLTTLVLDGPETNIGTITKLSSVEWFIKDGVIYWTNIENSSKYAINSINELNDDITLTAENFTIESASGKTIMFDPQLTGNNSYFIKAIGSENIELSLSSVGYVNSNFANGIYSYKHTFVDGVKTVQGELVWNPLDKFIGYDIGNYLLTFESEGQEDIIIEINSSYCLYNGYNIDYNYGLEVLSDLLAGNYKAYIQGFAKGHSVNSQNNNNNFSYFEDGKTVYLLLSEKQKSPYQVKKLDEVTDIIVTSVNLQNNEYTSSITFTDLANNPNAVYELTFIEANNQHSIIIRSDDEDRKSEFVHNAENATWTFYGIINESAEINEKLDYTLQIRRLATSDKEMNSNYTKYFDNENQSYYNVAQINPITETEIVLKNIDGVDHYVISWDSYIPKGLSTNLISYIFEYYSVDKNGQKSEPRQIFVTGRNYVNYDTEIIQESGTALLSYRIQVVIGAENSTTLNYINSRFSDDYEIKTPNSVESIGYDTEKQVFTWEYENSDTNNLVFIVKDYYVGDKEVLVDNLDSLDAYQRNEYTINVVKGTSSYEFAPQQIGYHIISIEVCVANFASSTVGNDEAFKSGAVFYQNIDGIYNEKFDLFTSGAGTESNPYIISNEQQFNNINLRKVTPSYIKTKYQFKQAGHLEITCSIEYTETDTIYRGFITGEFDGIYNGDNYSLKVNSTVYELNTANGVFAKLTTSAEIKNIHLLTNITGNVISSVNFAVLTKVNYGKISNIKIGNLNENAVEFTNIEYSVGFGILANENRGIIDKVVNNYNIIVTHSGKQSMASIDIGAIVRTNYKTITNSANNGQINATVYEGAVIGGIASKMDGGSISTSYNKGNITISYYSLGYGTPSGTYYVGGIVGNITNDGAKTMNCYVSGTININHNNINPTAVYVGGIAGNINLPSLVSNCYSSVNIKVQEVSAGVSLSTLYYYLMVGNIKQQGQTTNKTCYYLSSSSYSVAGGSGASNFKSQNYSNINDIVAKLNTTAEKDLFYLNGQQINLIVEQELNADIWKK